PSAGTAVAAPGPMRPVASAATPPAAMAATTRVRVRRAVGAVVRMSTMERAGNSAAGTRAVARWLRTAHFPDGLSGPQWTMARPGSGRAIVLCGFTDLLDPDLEHRVRGDLLERRERRRR